MSSTLKNRGRGRSPSPRVHSPIRKSRSLSPYRVSTLDRLESELENLELIHRKEVEEWLIKRYKPTEKDINDRMRAIDMEEEYKIYDVFSDKESTWHKKRRLKQMIAAERAQTKEGGRKTRRKYKNKKR